MELNIETAARLMALKYGVLTLDGLIEWADAKISAERDFDPRLIDVSLAKTIGEAVTGLDAFGPAADKPKVAARVFHIFQQSLASGEGGYQKIAKALFDMAMDDYVPVPELEGPMSQFWDDLDLAVDGVHGDAEAIKKELLSFLADAAG